ncbi:unnamed protein product [Trypanosoma congolense IL3000]|uniref:WGS project CAEQ00000000 data, annotated contig 994 n=1 Tax=Trypanosoma congolense (strain IL3000) TaxID=1068625 RepID=F9WK68_TRYCI|nr:unnamed protein product [Trypanosoma congolense IL3000]
MGMVLHRTILTARLVVSIVLFVVAERDQEPANGRLHLDGARALCAMYDLVDSVGKVTHKVMEGMEKNDKFIRNVSSVMEAKREEFQELLRKVHLNNETEENETTKEFAEALAAIAKARDLAKKQLSVATNVSRVAVRHAKEAIGKANGTGLNAVMLTYCNTTKPSGRSSRWFKVTNGNCDGGLVVPLNGSIYRIDCAGAAKPDASAVGSVTYQTMMLALRAWDAHKPKPKSMASDWKSTARREQKGCSKDGYSSEVACTASEKGWVGHYNSSAKELRKLEGASHAMQAAATEAKKQMATLLQTLRSLHPVSKPQPVSEKVPVMAEAPPFRQETLVAIYLMAAAASLFVLVPGFLLFRLAKKSLKLHSMYTPVASDEGESPER